MAGLEERDVIRALEWTQDVLKDLERLHRAGALHGGVCPGAVTVRGGGARLEAPGTATPPVEYRDPQRERDRIRDGRRPPPEPRHDVYGVGAVLFSVLDGGPPTCGSASCPTRPVAAAVAYLVARAMAEGPGRYPTAASMREDLSRLLRTARSRGLGAVKPEDLPGFSGPIAPAPRRLVPFEVRERRGRRRTRAIVTLSLLLIFGSWAFRALSNDRTEAREPARRAGILGLADEWRERLDDRLRATGERFHPGSVPLVVVSEVPVPRDLGWLLHPSESLAAAVREVLEEDVAASAVHAVLLARVGPDTVPAVLWIRGDRITLFYRTLRFDSSSR
jgi:hypothetical protein